MGIVVKRVNVWQRVWIWGGYQQTKWIYPKRKVYGPNYVLFPEFIEK
jgi:hypothetical protein